MQNQKKTAVVAGATGIAGRATAIYLSQQPDWNVIALARKFAPSAELPSSVIMVEADLLDPEQLSQALAPFKATHLFYTAWYNPQPNLANTTGRPMDPMRIKRQMAFARDWVVPQLKRSQRLEYLFYRAVARQAGLYDPELRNLTMLRTILDELTAPPHALEHVSLVTGGRQYGMHLGPSLFPEHRIPYTEDQPILPGPSSYTALEAEVSDRSADRFSWSIIRPTFIVGQSPKAATNIGYAIGIYAWLLKQANRPLVFPAGLDSYTAKGQFSASGLLAQMLTWSATQPEAANQIFNLVNGDVVSWADIWPWLGRYFQMEIQVPAGGANLETLLSHRQQDWAQLQYDHRLPAVPLESVFSLPFLAASFVIHWDVEYSMQKARSFGFECRVDTFDMFGELFANMAEKQIIPPMPSVRLIQDPLTR